MGFLGYKDRVGSCVVDDQCKTRPRVRVANDTESRWLRWELKNRLMLRIFFSSCVLLTVPSRLSFLSMYTIFFVLFEIGGFLFESSYVVLSLSNSSKFHWHCGRNSIFYELAVISPTGDHAWPKSLDKRVGELRGNSNHRNPRVL